MIKFQLPTIDKETITATGKNIIKTVRDERGLVVALGALALAGISYISTKKLAKIINKD